ncbi:MAG: hypothetical protein ACK54T_07045 [bacterium]
MESALIEACGRPDAIKMCNDGGPEPNEACIRIASEFLATSEDPHEGRVLLGILRRSPVPFDGQVLCDYFDRVKKNRWSTANGMYTSKAIVPCAWILRTLADDNFGRDREMLCYAVAKHCPPDKARVVLRQVFEDLPGHACWGLGVVGNEDDLKFLIEASTRFTTWRFTEINRAIKKIAKRLGKAAPAEQTARKRRPK